MSIQGLLNDDNELTRLANLEDDRKDIKYGVKREHVPNPFITKNGSGRFFDNERAFSSKEKNKGGVRRKSLNSFQEKGGINETAMKSIEYINMTTGDRRVENMDEEQQGIKPRRLRFD